MSEVFHDLLRAQFAGQSQQIPLPDEQWTSPLALHALWQKLQDTKFASFSQEHS